MTCIYRAPCLPPATKGGPPVRYDVHRPDPGGKLRRIAMHLIHGLHFLSESADGPASYGYQFHTATSQ